MSKTRWYPVEYVSPVRVGWYEVVYFGVATIVRRYFNGFHWLHCPESTPASCAINVTTGNKWRGLTERGYAESVTLKRCAADRDGDCVHEQCPQLRDGEPAKSRRHCPLDTRDED
jgi:hypothetical protein